MGVTAGGGVDFDLGLMERIAQSREPALTAFFQFWTAFGDVQGYVLLFALLFMAFDKPLALRFGVVALLAMSVNHALKELIQNPRPFMEGGLYLQRWAVSTHEAHALSKEFSTPSGHAMAAAAGYAYLAGKFRSPYAIAAAIVVVALIGASRPYLGVHYVEDVLLGWTLGVVPALLALRFGDGLFAAWGKLSALARASICLAFSAAVWTFTLALNQWDLVALPSAFLGELGFLTGLLVAWPWEARDIRLDPRSSALPAKALRVAIAIAVVALTLLALDTLFARIALDETFAGHALHYVRYVLTAFAGVLLAPFICIKLGLAATLRRA